MEKKITSKTHGLKSKIAEEKMQIATSVWEKLYLNSDLWYQSVSNEETETTQLFKWGL